MLRITVRIKEPTPVTKEAANKLDDIDFESLFKSLNDVSAIKDGNPSKVANPRNPAPQTPPKKCFKEDTKADSFTSNKKAAMRIFNTKVSNEDLATLIMTQDAITRYFESEGEDMDDDECFFLICHLKNTINSILRHLT